MPGDGRRAWIPRIAQSFRPQSEFIVAQVRVLGIATVTQKQIRPDINLGRLRIPRRQWKLKVFKHSL